MRFKLVFSVNKGEIFPFNYQYELSAGLFKVFMRIKDQVPKYNVMHKDDFLNHITFSRVEIPKRKIEKEGIRTLSGVVFLKVSIGFPDISSDLMFRAFSEFNNSLFLFKKMSDGSSMKVNLKLKDIEFLPSPDFKNTMKFKMLSPLVVSRDEESNKMKYISLKEKQEMIDRLKENLQEKYQQLYGQPMPADSFSVKFDPDYCSKREEKDLYSLVTMKEGAKGAFSILGVLVPFEIEAPAELIQVGYYSGFGDKTSFGFGMAEVIRKPRQ